MIFLFSIMPKVTARAKVKGKHYEIMVDLDEALKIKAGKGDLAKALDSNSIFTDMKKGNIAKSSDLIDAFGTDNIVGSLESALGCYTGTSVSSGVGAHTHTFTASQNYLESVGTGGAYVITPQAESNAAILAPSGTTDSTGADFPLIPPEIYLNVFWKL